MRVTFGGCVVDGDARELHRDGRRVPLSPKAYELLELLVGERPKALSKEKIHAKLWPKIFVSDASLTNVVAELRAALGDDAQKPRIIRTVQRFGYAFIAETQGARSRESVSPPFRIVWETREIDLHGGENVLGRDHDAVVWVDDPSVSRHHARIKVESDEAVLEDLGSKNGTLRNGKRIERPARLSDGDEIRIGRASLTFRAPKQTSSTESMTRPSTSAPTGRKRR